MNLERQLRIQVLKLSSLSLYYRRWRGSPNENLLRAQEYFLFHTVYVVFLCWLQWKFKPPFASRISITTCRFIFLRITVSRFNSFLRWVPQWNKMASAHFFLYTYICNDNFTINPIAEDDSDIRQNQNSGDGLIRRETNSSMLCFALLFIVKVRVTFSFKCFDNVMSFHRLQDFN